MPLWRNARAILAISLLVGALALFTVPGMKLLAVFYLVPFIVGFAALGILSLVAGALALRKRAWRRAAIEGTAVVAIASVFVLPELLLTPLRTLSSYGQLAIVYPKLKEQIDAWPPEDAPKVLVVETDGFLSGSSGLAFDESNEIRNVPGTQSAAWKARVSNTPLYTNCWYATHLIGSFYAWSGELACE